MPDLYYPLTRLDQARISRGSEEFVPLQSTKSPIATLQDDTTHPPSTDHHPESKRGAGHTGTYMRARTGDGQANSLQHQPEAQEPGKDHHTITGGSKGEPRTLDNSGQIPEPAR
jgi:hypothetical protein